MCVHYTGRDRIERSEALDKSLLSARTMINLDSEDEGVATVSCAGGLRFGLTRPITRSKKEGMLLHLEADRTSGAKDIPEQISTKNIRMPIC